MIMMPGLPQLNGFLICYMDKKEMETVYKRLKDLKLPEVLVKKSWNPIQNLPYPWTIALICKDKKKVDEVDDYLVANKIDLGGRKEMYVGEPRILEFFRMLPLDGKYEPGIARIAAGECPLNAQSAMSCQFCPVGHMLECHAPMTCSQAKCSHLAKYDEDVIYRDE